MGAIETPLMDFLNKVENINSAGYKWPQWHSSDTTLVTSVFYPEWIKETEYRHVVAITSGEFRGGLVVDRSNSLKRYKNAIIIRNVDQELYKNLLLKTFE